MPFCFKETNRLVPLLQGVVEKDIIQNCEFASARVRKEYEGYPEGKNVLLLQTCYTIR